ncbi:MAG: neuraminidase (sialidase), partial [Armatimonadetes bacterium]|nr:neuraminidase (sialidase) [Armatimonadota bacterium]
MTQHTPLHEHAFGDDRPFASCHASTLVELASGETLVAYFAGTHEKNPDVGIWHSRRTPAGWEPPRKVADFGGIAHWNPALFQAPDGRLWLFYKVGHVIPEWQTHVVTSADEGRTWTDPRELVPGDVGGRGPVKNKPI